MKPKIEPVETQQHEKRRPGRPPKKIIKIEPLDRRVLSSRTDPASLRKLFFARGYIVIKNQAKHVIEDNTDQVMTELKTLANQGRADYVFESFDSSQQDGFVTNPGSMSRIQVNFNANIDWSRSNLVTIKDGSKLFTDLVREDIRAVLFNAFEKAKLLVKPPFESYSSMIRMGVLGSLEKSSFQEVHMDYSPPTNEVDQNQVIDGESGRFGRGMSNYFEQSKCDIPPLSIIVAGPRGAELIVYPQTLNDSESHMKEIVNRSNNRENISLSHKHGKLTVIDNVRVKTEPMGPVHVKLEAYDSIIFRQDLYHQGVGYLNENYRLYAYIDIKTLPRAENKSGLNRVPLNENLLITKDMFPSDSLVYVDHPNSQKMFKTTSQYSRLFFNNDHF